MDSYLFLAGRSLSALREAAATTHADHYRRLLAQADSYLDRLPPADHPRETITYIGMAVANLGLAFLISEEPRYLEAARRWIAVAIGYPHWGKAHMPDHDLDAGWLCFGLGLAYNWLGPALPPNERADLRAKLLLQGRRLYAFAVESEGHWWSSAYWQNHNWICYAGLATTAYALEDEHPETRAWSARALENFRSVMALLPEDGSDYEGPVYWNYGFPWILIACDLFAQQAGVDLHDNPFLRNAFAWRMAVAGPNLVDTANLGDCHDRRSAHSAAICYRLAALFQDGRAQALANEFEASGEWERERREGLLRPGMAPQAMLEFLWYDATLPPMPLDTLPLVQHFPDMGLVSARTGWAADATVLVFKCGKPSGAKAWAAGFALNNEQGWDTLKASHAHPDEGGFLLMRGGDYLVVDEGYSQEKRSRHHSVLLVDGRGQYREDDYNAFAGTGPLWGGRLEQVFAAGPHLQLAAEAAGAYDPALGVRRMRRQILALGLRLLLVCDDIALAEPRRLTWLLQSDVAPEPTDAGHLVCAGDSQLRVLPLLPGQLAARAAAEEIVAYPSSSTPEWVLRHTQHRLELEPATPVAATRLLSLLNVEGAGAASPSARLLATDAGDLVEVRAPDGHTTILAFAADARGLRAPGLLESDGAWALTETAGGNTPRSLAVGAATQLWVGGQLWLEAAQPVSAAWDGDGWTVESDRPTWATLRGLGRVALPAGRSALPARTTETR